MNYSVDKSGSVSIHNNLDTQYMKILVEYENKDGKLNVIKINTNVVFDNNATEEKNKINNYQTEEPNNEISNYQNDELLKDDTFPFMYQDSFIIVKYKNNADEILNEKKQIADLYSSKIMQYIDQVDFEYDNVYYDVLRDIINNNNFKYYEQIFIGGLDAILHNQQEEKTNQYSCEYTCRNPYI